VDFSNINEASVGLYLDEVYLASQGAGAMQLFDLERVEVLRGPQGTLFGRNTTAGVTQYVSRKPGDEFDARASLQYGQNNQVIAELAAGGPLTDRVRGRLAFKYNEDDGWQENELTGEDTASADSYAARGILAVDLSEAWEAELNYHYAENDGTTPIPLALFGLDPNDLTQYCGGTPVIGGASDQSHADAVLSGRCANDLGVVLRGQDADQGYSQSSDWPMEYESSGGYVKVIGDTAFATVTSITAYDEYDQHFGYDIDTYDYTDSVLQNDLGTDWASDAEQFSQEVRLNGEYNGNTWTAGAFYYTAEQSSVSATRVLVTVPGSGPLVVANPTDALTETDSWAAFGQLETPISETLTAVAGLRYTDETRKLARLECPTLPSAVCPPPGTGTSSDEIDTQATTGKMALEWRPGDDQLYYVQFSHGFKSGGFNPQSDVGRRGPVEEETVDSWELGIKRYFFDSTVRFNAAVFYNQFKGLQALVGSVDENSNPIVFYINAGDPDIVGAELELAWAPNDQFEALLGVGLLDTEISAEPTISADGRPLDGKELPQAPDLSLNAVVRYSLPLGDAGRLTLQADGRWQDDVFTGVDNDPVEFVESYGVLNLRARWLSPDLHLSAEAFVDNVTDETVIQHIFHNTVSGHTDPANAAGVQDGFRIPGRPRLWGVRVGYQF
jgi:iron complex outermembrane receptor protein